MSWNDGHERRRFEQKQRAQANEYHITRSIRPIF